MAELALYAHPVDVLRKFNPQLTQNTLDQNDYIGNNDEQQIRARIDSVSSELEAETGAAFRLQRTGSPAAPETYEHQGVKGEPRPPMRVSLDHRNVLPFDSNQDDTVEVRTGKDDWTDITADAGDEFVLKHHEGVLEVYRFLIQRIYWDARDNRYLRATYRYGALGGNQDIGGQTTLDGSLGGNDTDTSVSVADAARLPNRGVLLLGNDEYVRVTDVNYSTDTLTVDRGVRSTSVTSHSDGDVVHYCPEDIRDAVAAKTARELLRYDDWVDELVEAGQGLGASDKMDAWQETWESALENESTVRKL